MKRFVDKDSNLDPLDSWTPSEFKFKFHEMNFFK